MPRKDKTQIKAAIETQAKTKGKNKPQEIDQDQESGEVKQIFKSEEKTKTKKKEVSVSNVDDKDSSDISDMADNESISDAFKYDAGKKSQSNGEEDYDDMDEQEKKEYIQTVVLDRVIKYIKLDDVIKQKQSEHKK